MLCHLILCCSIFVIFVCFGTSCISAVYLKFDFKNKIRACYVFYLVDLYKELCCSNYLPVKDKENYEGIGSLFHPFVNAIERQPYCRSRIEVSSHPGHERDFT